MINSRHVYFYWGGPLLFGPPQCISLGGPDPPTPPGIDAPARNYSVKWAGTCGLFASNEVFGRNLPFNFFEFHSVFSIYPSETEQYAQVGTEEDQKVTKSTKNFYEMYRQREKW